MVLSNIFEDIYSLSYALFIQDKSKERTNQILNSLISEVQCIHSNLSAVFS